MERKAISIPLHVSHIGDANKNEVIATMKLMLLGYRIYWRCQICPTKIDYTSFTY